ncbi:MAG: hypothetical protein LBS02_00950, partial [Hungatella sp.]|nr:hypothetical protein [Hungatella sp.]
FFLYIRTFYNKNRQRGIAKTPSKIEGAGGAESAEGTLFFPAFHCGLEGCKNEQLKYDFFKKLFTPLQTFFKSLLLP